MPAEAWEARGPLVYVSFYIELPFDVGLDIGQATRKIHLVNGPLEEWSDLDLDALLGMPPFEEKGTFPCTTFYFRRAVLATGAPLTAVTTAFPEHFEKPEQLSTGRRVARLIRELASLCSGRIREDVTRATSEASTPRESRTVVQAVRVVEHQTGIFSSAWLDEQFDIVVDSLNEYLLALAAASGDLRMGPVTRAQLPPVVAGFQADFRDGLPLRLQPLTFWSHPNIPKLGRNLPKPVVEHAMNIVGGPRDARPFFPTLELMVASQRSFFAARSRHAVLESGTAIELMIHTAVREVGTAEGWPPERLAKVGRVFRNLVQHHFAPIFGFSPDVDASNDALGHWWQTGYRLRNRVAHDGHQPDRDETLAALTSAEGLNDALGVALSKHPHTTARFPHQALHQPPSLAELLQDAAPDAAEALLHEDETLDPAVRAFNLGVIFLRQGREEEAEVELRRAVEISGHPGAALNCGSFCIARGEIDEAVALYKLAADSQNPKYTPRAALALGDVLAMTQPEDSEYYYRRAITTDEKDVVPDACFALGSLLEATGRFLEAERAWEQGAALGDGRSAANVGNRRQARGDRDGAERAFRQAMEDERIRPLVGVNLGLLLLDLGRDEEAAASFEEASNLGNGRAALHLAAIRLEQGDVDAATRQLDRADGSSEIDVVNGAAEMRQNIGPPQSAEP
ncbi:MAG: tetratricopeptide repeat protein [Solirubrobacteraceae bacterium]